MYITYALNTYTVSRSSFSLHNTVSAVVYIYFPSTLYSCSRKVYHHSTEDDSSSIVFKNSKSRDKEGLGDSSVSVSVNRPRADSNNQETSISDCSTNLCVVNLHKRPVPATHLDTNIECTADVSKIALTMKEPVCKGKITSTKNSHESTSSSDNSNVSVDKVMVKYQQAKHLASIWKIENPFIQVSL